jgi:hypothetical protein
MDSINGNSIRHMKRILFVELFILTILFSINAAEPLKKESISILLATKISKIMCSLEIIGFPGCGAQVDKKEVKNEEETRKTVSFLWSSPDDPYLAQMRSEFGLEQVVAGAVDRFDEVKRLSRWTRTKWEHDGWAEPGKNDPISILREAATGKRFRCVEYGIVLAGALNAVGIPARQLNLKTRDVEMRELGAGHVVVEAYLIDLGKWIMIDPQFDAIPTLADSPMNALELGRALERGDANLRIITSSGTDTKGYFAWIRQYLFYFDVYLDNRYPKPATNKGLMLVPIGAPNPTVFQIKYPIKNIIYTHSEKEFYAAPPAAKPGRK